LISAADKAILKPANDPAPAGVAESHRNCYYAQFFRAHAIYLEAAQVTLGISISPFVA